MASVIDSTAPPLGGTLRLRSTLLHRPAPAERALTRSCLCAQLDEGLGCALTLVSAPPGFGKSVLVNQWSHTLDRRCAWLSLDSSIDELRWFLAHLVAAIDLVCPDTMSLTSQMVGAAEFPDEQALVTELSNELDELEEPIAIVLEDYHLINSPSIHRLMSELLRHPPAAVHFVIITRQDPPLPLASLRSKGRVRDVRMDDLAFSNDETLQLVDLELGRRLPADQERALERSTEGWPIGVRMAIEAIRTSPSGTTVLGAGFLDRGTQEYLLAEVLEGLPADVRRYLLTASLFDQFTAKLCEVAMGDVASRPTMMSGAEFIDWVSSHNLFIIALDAEGVWFRFHHLFGHLLQHWRSTRGIDLDLPEAEAHRSAARYLESEGLIEEAIEQFALAP